jgi:hypothetical protein
MMHRAPAELIKSGAAQRAKKAGDVAPLFSLRDSEGNLVSLAGLLMCGPASTMASGAHTATRSCKPSKPSSRSSTSMAHFSLQSRRRTLQKLPQIGTPEQLSFLVLSDVKGRVGAAYRLRFDLPDQLIELYNDLPTFNDDPRWTLSMPSRYVIGQDGVIIYSEVNLYYTRHANPEEMIPVLQRASTRTRLERDLR